MKLTLHNIYLPGRAGRVEEQPRSQVFSLSLLLRRDWYERTLGRRLVEEKGIKLIIVLLT